MHIIAAIVAIAGVLFLVLMRMQQASRAVGDIAEAADGVRGFFRRLAWSRKAQVNPLDAVTDPREAAAAMMVAIAEADGAVSDAERRVMLTQMSEHLGASPTLAEELFARGRWLVQGKINVGETLRRLSPSILTSCSPTERRDLVAMLRAVAAADGADSDLVEAEIRRVALLLKG